jgi:hypothetical protein
VAGDFGALADFASPCPGAAITSRLPWPYLACCVTFKRQLYLVFIARVLRADSPPTRGRRSIGSGGESSSMLTSVEWNAGQGRTLL